ncbi:hypothetical protein NITMOv2_4228 [Nitrospira moscoviensis]|uniref:Uncharacterized protein n=1 Tax=Nitrospira moscoviensis TaxID=42253 RepID=A0A0K2GIZ4_NITMO|nr:hypothetical protein NITMOv2_4228 [Nitrospira moscoviensis]
MHRSQVTIHLLVDGKHVAILSPMLAGVSPPICKVPHVFSILSSCTCNPAHRTSECSAVECKTYCGITPRPSHR